MNPEVPEPVGEHALDPGLALSTPRLEHSAVPPPHPTPSIPDHELLKKIGGGSYGDVWLARSKLGTYRAVKIVYRATFEDSRPFEREFKGIQKFEPISRSHEGLVDILQVGGTEEYFYYVMELADDAGENPKTEIRDPKQAREENPRSETRNPKEVRTPNTEKASEGKPVRNSAFGVASGFGIRNSDSYMPRTLRAEQQQQGRLMVGESVSIGLALASALAHLHKHGLVHRDVKPSNIIFIGGVPKLADIGLVAETTDARTYVGTEGFIPPEGPGTAQADIYGLGKVLYEISTGLDRRDFPGLPGGIGAPEARDDDSALRTPHSAFNESAFLELNAVVVKACKVEPRERYPSAEEMHADLALLERGSSVIQKRALQRHLAVAKKLSIAAVSLALLGVGAWLLVNRFRASTYQRFNMAKAEVNSIAVIPFFNQSTKSGDEYLSDALTDETINALANCAGLRVASRSAVFQFKGRTNAFDSAGAELGVRTVLAGSFLRNSNGMHLTAWLSNMADAKPLWSARLDSGGEELGALGANVIKAAARGLGFALEENVLNRAQTNLLRKLAAFELYSQAITNWGNTQDGLDRGIRLLNQAIAEDPSHAQAYAALAYRYQEASGFYLPQAQAMTAAKANALRAVQLDDSLPLAHCALGFVYYRHELDLAQAKAHFQRAIELAPNNGGYYGDFAHAFSSFGLFKEADEVLKRGDRADPSNHNLLGGWWWRYYLERDFVKARQAADRFVTVHPNSVMGPWFLALTYEGLREYDKALALAQRAVQIDPSPDSFSLIGRLHARLGHREEAQKALEEVRVLSQSPGGARTFLAEVLVSMGEPQKAIESLRRAVDEYPPAVLYLKSDPLWDELRADPRFQALLRKVNLEK